MLKSSLCISDAYIRVKRTITITGGPAVADEVAKRLAERSKGVISKHCASFSDCIDQKKKKIPKQIMQKIWRL